MLLLARPPGRAALGTHPGCPGAPPARQVLCRRPHLLHPCGGPAGWTPGLVSSPLRPGPRRPRRPHAILFGDHLGCFVLVALGPAPAGSWTLDRGPPPLLEPALSLPARLYSPDEEADPRRHVRLHGCQGVAPPAGPTRRGRRIRRRGPHGHAQAKVALAAIKTPKPLRLGAHRSGQNRTWSQVRHLDLAGHRRESRSSSAAAPCPSSLNP